MNARLLTRPIAGFFVLLLIALVLIGVAFAAYHGSEQTPPSSCATGASLLRRTAADAEAARRTAATAGRADLGALTTDGARLTAQIQNDPSSDVAYDERVLPLTDAINQAVSDVGTSHEAADLDRVTSAATSAAAYCGV